jgi:hypothetical protein
MSSFAQKPSLLSLLNTVGDTGAFDDTSGSDASPLSRSLSFGKPKTTRPSFRTVAKETLRVSTVSAPVPV